VFKRTHARRERERGVNLFVLESVEDGSEDLPSSLQLVVAHKQVVVALDDVEDQTLVG
jgi:hypothetical protein